MKLHAALGWSLMYTPGHERPTGNGLASGPLKSRRPWVTSTHQLRALWGLWAVHYNNGNGRRRCTCGTLFRSRPTRAMWPILHIADRMIGVALHFLGDQTGARRHIERMLGRVMRTPANRSHIVRFQFEQRVTARVPPGAGAVVAGICRPGAA